MIEENLDNETEEENFNLPQQRLINVLYATSLVIGNFFIPEEQNIFVPNEVDNDPDFILPVVQGYNLTNPTTQSFFVNGINELISNGVGLHSARLLQTQRPYNGSYSITFTNDLENNIISSSAISTSLITNEVRRDYLVGGGDYLTLLQNININPNAYWTNFCNILSGNALQNVNNTPFLQDMMGLYCCEISRCPASLITIPIFYSMFSDNQNMRDLILPNFNNFGINNNNALDNIINVNTVIPPIMLNLGTPSANILINGTGANFLNEFFELLDFNWIHDTQRPARIRFTETVRFAFLEERLVAEWYNQLNIENQIILNELNINHYSGNLINNIQSHNVINSILTFFNNNFNMGFNHGDIEHRIDLINDILEHPENTNWLLQEFNANLMGNEQNELMDIN
jgi:hypothetical protein